MKGSDATFHASEVSQSAPRRAIEARVLAERGMNDLGDRRLARWPDRAGLA